MTRTELRATGQLAGIYWLRMLGLFMILPVFSAHSGDYAGATPMLVGLAVGVYGLTQALLQIPFGVASDRFGRKPVIALGLLIFAAGSVLAGMAESIEAVIVGRALQGAGAIAAAINALVADTTSEESRTPAMAIVGISIGAAFLVALILGPVLAAAWGVSALFYMTAGLAALGLLLLSRVRAPPPRLAAVPVSQQLGAAMTTTGVKPLYAGIFLLHAVMTAAFVVIPLLLRDQFAILAEQQWRVFAPVMLASVLPLPLLVYFADRLGHQRAVFAFCIVLAAAALLGAAAAQSVWLLGLALAAYFAGFNCLEAMLPSLASKAAPHDIRGAVMGVYASAQYFGAFVGGALGGLALGAYGGQAVLIGSAVALVSWLLFVHRTPMQLRASRAVRA